MLIEISDELKKRFNMALQLNGENMEEVLNRLIAEYISKTFYYTAEEVAGKSNCKVDEQEDKIEKAVRKIPIWSTRPSQNNHKIIKAYLEIEQEMGYVLSNDLEARCSDINKFQTTYVKDFRGNFAQLRTDAGNSHGKVFELVGDYVVIWNKVQNVLNKYRNNFLNSVDNGGSNMKITIDMSKMAFPIAKKVYEGNISRTEAAREISRETGMNEGSALAFVTIFLAMMNGEVYKRAFNNQTNEFLLKTIKNEYGEEAFKKAIFAARKHIEYYDTLGKGHLGGLERILDRLENK